MTTPARAPVKDAELPVTFPVTFPTKEVAVIAPAANSPDAPLVTMALFVLAAVAVVMALVMAPFAMVVAP